VAALTCKPSVRFKAFTPALLRILRAVYTVAQGLDLSEVVITSANDSGHMVTSRHYTDEAIDLRTKNFPTEASKLRFAAALRADLGPAFTVLYEYPKRENQHLHIQPRRGTTYAGPV
jgi:hypothetical protein